MYFLAPHEWHRYLESIDWHFVLANLTGTLDCS